MKSSESIIGFALVVFAVLTKIEVVLIGLKLFGVITWPWILILAPLWIPVALFVAFVTAVLMVCLAGRFLGG